MPEVPSPLVYENRVYYVRNGGILTCLEAATGRVVYRERLGAPGPYYSSPIEAGGRLFIDLARERSSWSSQELP